MHCKFFFTTLIFIGATLSLCAQIKYSGKLAYNNLDFKTTLIRYEAGPGFKGYFFDDRQNGKEISLVNGISYKNKFFAGIGLSYLNFEDDIKGFSATLDLEYLVLKTKLSPLINFKIGQSFLHNNKQNRNNNAGLGGLDVGLNYKIVKNIGFYFKTGFMITQNSSFGTLQAGFRF